MQRQKRSFASPKRSFASPKRPFAGGTSLIIAACAVLVPAVVIWVLLGEFDVLGLGYVHAQGGSTGLCFADATTNTPVACGEGAQVLLYGSSHVGWPMALAASLLVAWAVGLCLVLWALRLASPRVFPFAVATAFVGAITCLSGAVPHASDGLLIFARVLMVLAGAVVGFVVANVLTNAMVLLTGRGGAVYEQVAREVSDAGSDRKKRLAGKRKGSANDKDYVEGVKR